MDNSAIGRTASACCSFSAPSSGGSPRPSLGGAVAADHHHARLTGPRCGSTIRTSTFRSLGTRFARTRSGPTATASGCWLLKPFHSFTLVTFTQHLMGLATAVLIYALLLRKFRLPKWGATLAAAPVLFDAYQIQLEQLIMSDTQFTLLVGGRDHAGALAPADVVADGRPGRPAAGAHLADPPIGLPVLASGAWSTC